MMEATRLGAVRRGRLGHRLANMPANLDKQIDQLYTAPVGSFVERRNELARSLRQDGNREGAAEVKGLRKPTVPAWAVNQLARREKMRLRSLFTAGERLRKAHEKLLGGGSPEALQQARDDERAAIAELAGAAASLLTEAGHPASEATLDSVRETLHAAAADEEIGQRVRAGRLEREEAVTGFGFGSPPPGARAKPATQAKEEAAREKRARERRAEQEKKARKKRRAEERLRDARSALRETERAVQRQARELERSEAALRRRQAEAESAEQELERARR